MKKLLLSSFICCIGLVPKISFAQETQEVKSIKIKKENLFTKAAFSEADYKVIALDRYGNPHENAIKSFAIFYKEGKNVYEAPVTGNTFPENTIRFLTKKKTTATKVCLTKLKAEDKDGHLEDLPDLCDIVIFPDCKKTKKHK